MDDDIGLLATPEAEEGLGYEVGYKKPPTHSRFPPGQSGNPKGRPKGAKGFTTLLGKAMQETVILQKNGKPHKASKLEVAILQLANKAAQGDPKAMQFLAPFIREMEAKAEGLKKELALTEADIECIRQLPKMYNEPSEN